MKLIKLFVVLLVVGGFYFMPSLSQASYITMPGSVGMPLDIDSCSIATDGTVAPASSSDTCIVYFPIPIASSSTLSSVTVYYYDNSGSQYMGALLTRSTLSSDSSTDLASGSDSSTSASVQSKTLSYGSTTSSSYVYFVAVWLQNGTELRGIKIYY